MFGDAAGGPSGPMSAEAVPDDPGTAAIGSGKDPVTRSAGLYVRELRRFRPLLLQSRPPRGSVEGSIGCRWVRFGGCQSRRGARPTGRPFLGDYSRLARPDGSANRGVNPVRHLGLSLRILGLTAPQQSRPKVGRDGVVAGLVDQTHQQVGQRQQFGCRDQSAWRITGRWIQARRADIEFETEGVAEWRRTSRRDRYLCDPRPGRTLTKADCIAASNTGTRQQCGIATRAIRIDRKRSSGAVNGREMSIV